MKALSMEKSMSECKNCETELGKEFKESICLCDECGSMFCIDCMVGGLCVTCDENDTELTERDDPWPVRTSTCSSNNFLVEVSFNKKTSFDHGDMLRELSAVVRKWQRGDGGKEIDKVPR